MLIRVLKNLKYNVHEHRLCIEKGACGELIILLLGGHCSFDLQTSDNKDFINKRGVDLTLPISAARKYI